MFPHDNSSPLSRRQNAADLRFSDLMFQSPRKKRKTKENACLYVVLNRAKKTPRETVCAAILVCAGVFRSRLQTAFLAPQLPDRHKMNCFAARQHAAAEKHQGVQRKGRKKETGVSGVPMRDIG